MLWKLYIQTTGYKINTDNTINAGAINMKALIEDSLDCFFKKKSNKKLDK